jgi:ABC-type transport system involved in cytochrome bd biosynthesis, ATPase and permease components
VNDFLAQLPQGLDTPLGDGGLGLSVGQAQRVAVARALLKPAQLLLLDEPGAGLDSQSEQHVMHALHQAATQQTTLMITHQLNALADWDEVWVMQSGQLVQQGCWQQLKDQEGPLREMMQHRQQEIV